MPLHLLGKKSWNVYNPAAIARVRADEEAEEARLQAEDERQQAHNAERRLAILRGLPIPRSPSPLPSEFVKRNRDEGDTSRSNRTGKDDYRKRRRINGEDDTDRDIRLAQEEERKRVKAQDAPPVRKTELAAPITDHAGHIQLFVPPSTKGIRVIKNAETEHKRREQESAEQGAFRFSDAAGYKKNIKENPWYAEPRNYSGTEELDQKYFQIEDISTGRDAFGNLDQDRGKRDVKRLTSADPMAMMQQAQRQLKNAESERDRWRKERERELRELKETQEREERRRRKRRGNGDVLPVEILNGFSLDDVGMHSPRKSQRHQAGHQRRRSGSVEELEGQRRSHHGRDEARNRRDEPERRSHHTSRRRPRNMYQ